MSASGQKRTLFTASLYVRFAPESGPIGVGLSPALTRRHRWLFSALRCRQVLACDDESCRVRSQRGLPRSRQDSRRCGRSLRDEQRDQRMCRSLPRRCRQSRRISPSPSCIVAIIHPTNAPLTTRAESPMACVREEVFGSTSTTYSPTAATARTIPQMPPRTINPAATGVKVRSPETKPRPRASKRAVTPRVSARRDGGCLVSAPDKAGRKSRQPDLGFPCHKVALSPSSPVFRGFALPCGKACARQGTPEQAARQWLSSKARR